MGFVSWVAVSLAAFFAGRLTRPGRVKGWRDELFVSLPAGILAGMVATSLDFGGWRELDWKSALFALLVAISAIAAVRLVRLSRTR